MDTELEAMTAFPPSSEPKEATSSPHQLPGPLPVPVSQATTPENNPEKVQWVVLPPAYSEGSALSHYKATDDCLEPYRMKSSPRGLAIIISSKVFSGTLERREGTDLDADGLERLFSWLDFDVRLFKDLTGKQMVETLRGFSQMDHSSMDCLVVAVLTHGKENQLYCSDAKLMDMEDIFMPFNGCSCPSLIGKPKLFLIQHCRGVLHDCGIELTGGEGAEPTLDDLIKGTEEMLKINPQEWKDETDGKTLVLPTELDMVVMYATVPGYVSWRDRAFGSWFIKAFVDIMFAHAAKHSFSNIMTMVNYMVTDKFQPIAGRKQMPQSVLQLTRELFFNPPKKPRWISPPCALL